jgi:hypothetical protein
MFPHGLQELSRGIMDDNHTSWAYKEMDVQFSIIVVGYKNNTRLIRERKGKTKNHGDFRRGSKF